MSETAGLFPNPSNTVLNILLPLPDYDFDPTEASIPWSVCHSKGWKVTISTEHGAAAQPDFNKLKGLLPGILTAGPRAQEAYRLMSQDASYQRPIPYSEIDPEHYHAILLPGGDAPRMRQYLESELLRSKVLLFYKLGKIIGAICHGTLVLARTVDPQTGQSIIYGHKITTVPKGLDKTAYLLDSWFTKRGYIMYSSCVEDEVRGCLKDPADLTFGPGIFTPYVVSDGLLVTSRTYIDAEKFSDCFANVLEKETVQRLSQA